MTFRQGLAEPQQDVVDEHDRHADNEARQLAVAPVGGAKRQADQAEHEACRGYRELLVNLEELIVRKLPLRADLVRLGAQFGNRHFAVALRRAALGEHHIRAEIEQDLSEAVDVVVARGISGVTSAVFEDDFDRSLRAIDQDASVLGVVDRGALAAAVVGHEDAVPSAGRRDLAHVEVDVRESIEERPRLDFSFRLRGDDVERDLARALIARRDRDQEHVGRGAETQHGNQTDREEQPSGTDAAGLKCDELAIG